MPNVSYFPVLKAKQGELNALSEWGSDTFPTVAPILEIVPWERDDGLAGQERSEVAKVATRVERAWSGKEGLLYLDAAAAEPDPEEGWVGTTPVIAQLLEILWEKGINVAPAIRASAQSDYIAVLRSSISLDETDALIRITAEDLDDTVTPLRDVVSRVADGAGLSPERTRVMLDFGAISEDAAAAMAARLARFVLPQLDGGSWQSLILASGAFPINLSDVAPHTIARIDRHDAALWRTLRELELREPLDFADYAVTHPVLPTGGAFAAPPQLRYTHGREWIVSKGRRNDRRGHAQFFDICAGVLDHLGETAAGPSESWGDLRVHQAAAMARGNGTVVVGPGNASTWRAIATSHHITLVARRLAELGEP